MEDVLPTDDRPQHRPEKYCHGLPNISETVDAQRSPLFIRREPARHKTDPDGKRAPGNTEKKAHDEQVLICADSRNQKSRHCHDHH